MGKPRLIILVRHAQSEGNKNREIHQYIPDHRVKLTPEGWEQALDAGVRMRKLLRKTDTIRVYCSPYLRTRQTTEGILTNLVAEDEFDEPSPFRRENIELYEEPRLREQDFGNFQPCRYEMQRMMIERSQFSTFYYRIPNGESASDVYDRVSSFNESLWRSFAEPDFPSVCIIVTHGLTTRVFLMRWYRWTPEYFEDLRNIHHCEFLQMERNDKDKYDLLNKMRTWSELHEANGTSPEDRPSSPSQVTFKWGGCSMGCDHANMKFPMMHMKRQDTTMHLNKMEDTFEPTVQRQSVSHAQTQTNEVPSSSSAVQSSSAIEEPNDDEEDDHPLGALESRAARMSISSYTSPNRTMSLKKLTSSTMLHPFEERETVTGRGATHLIHRHHAHTQRRQPHHPKDGGRHQTVEGIDIKSSEVAPESEDLSMPTIPQNKHHHQAHFFLSAGRDGGGSQSGMGSPTISDGEADDPFHIGGPRLTHEPQPISKPSSGPFHSDFSLVQPERADNQNVELRATRSHESVVEHHELEQGAIKRKD